MDNSHVTNTNNAQAERVPKNTNHAQAEERVPISSVSTHQQETYQLLSNFITCPTTIEICKKKKT